MATAIWNYDQTFDAVRVSATQWNELYEYALANDPKLAGQMSGALQGKILGNAGTSVVVSGAMAKTLQKAAQLKSGIGKPPPTATSPSGTKHPLLDDAIPRNGDRPVVNQGALSTCGHNSCGMVLDTMGKPVNIVGLINKTPPTPGGITSMQVAGILKSEGVEASAWAGRKVSDISRYTSNGTPIVVRIIDKNGGSGFSHFVVVDGVTSRNGIPVVAIRDPWGKQYFSPVTTFERNFTGEVIVPKGWQK